MKTKRDREIFASVQFQLVLAIIMLMTTPVIAAGIWSAMHSH